MLAERRASCATHACIWSAAQHLRYAVDLGTRPSSSGLADTQPSSQCISKVEYSTAGTQRTPRVHARRAHCLRMHASSSLARTAPAPAAGMAPTTPSPHLPSINAGNEIPGVSIGACLARPALRMPSARDRPMHQHPGPPALPPTRISLPRMRVCTSLHALIHSVHLSFSSGVLRPAYAVQHALHRR